MRAPELLGGVRVVATPAAIDAAQLPSGAVMLRIAPDDAIIAGAASLDLDDPYAIVEPEYAFVHWRLTRAEFDGIIDHIEWSLPAEGQLGQGLIAGVPAKVMITPDEVLLVVSAGLAHELSERVW